MFFHLLKTVQLIIEIHHNPSCSAHSRVVFCRACEAWTLAFEDPVLRLIFFYFHLQSPVFVPDSLPSNFAHLWSIHFCHFNSSRWNCAINSEFHGSVHR